SREALLQSTRLLVQSDVAKAYFVLRALDAERALVGHWTFDGAVLGAVVIDSSGHGHHGIPSVGPPMPSSSIPRGGRARSNSGSLLFDGVNQLVDLGNPPGMQISGPITLAAWVNPTATDGLRNVITHGFRFGPDQEVTLRIRDGMYQMMSWDGTERIAELAVPAADLGTWVHLCGVYDGAGYILYRNGQRVDLRDDLVPPPIVDAPWAIGGRSASTPVQSPRGFEGLIDDVRVYARALSAGEVAALLDR
ncbi:MAG: LamG domain-containing protein, partial [Pseudomonadota bacterium]